MSVGRYWAKSFVHDVPFHQRCWKLPAGSGYQPAGMGVLGSTDMAGATSFKMGGLKVQPQTMRFSDEFPWNTGPHSWGVERKEGHNLWVAPLSRSHDWPRRA